MENTTVPCTVHKMTMINGETVPLTLTFDALYKLGNEKPDVLNDYNDIMAKGARTELMVVRVIYVAYLCGLIKLNGDTDGAYEYEEFLGLIPPDRDYIGKILMKLIAPKKTMASAALS